MTLTGRGAHDLCGLLFLWIIDLNYLLHLHVHRPLTASRTLNRLLDMALGSMTAMTSANWRIQHVFGHHLGKDEDYSFRSLDWTLQRYSLRGALAYSLGNDSVTFWELSAIPTARVCATTFRSRSTIAVPSSRRSA